MAKKRLSRDQKRKAKLASRGKRDSQASLAYTGNRFKKTQFTPLVFNTELGIHEADVMSHQKLTDSVVTAALEKLVLQLRQGPLPAQEVGGEIRIGPDEDPEFIIWNVRRQWQILSEEGSHFSREDTIGVLRTLLSSVANWSSGGPQSRGYLHFLQGFMRKGGVSVRVMDENMEPVEDDSEEDDLLAAGEAWCHDGDREAEAYFKREAEALLRSGEAAHLSAVCKQLLGTIPEDQAIVVQLSALAHRADAAVQRNG
jgi:hypothetical protein